MMSSLLGDSRSGIGECCTDGETMGLEPALQHRRVVQEIGCASAAATLHFRHHLRQSHKGRSPTICKIGHIDFYSAIGNVSSEVVEQRAKRRQRFCACLFGVGQHRNEGVGKHRDVSKAHLNRSGASQRHFNGIKDQIFDADQGRLRTFGEDVVGQAGELALERIQITQHTSLGALWFAGWLFTIGYLHQGGWHGLLGLIVWPYFLGSHFSP